MLLRDRKDEDRMNDKEWLQRIDHTQLKAFAGWEDIKKLCKEALEYHTASVCIPPCYVKRVRETYGKELNICTVIGFPLGYSTSSAKAEETRAAIEDGADEIDMVINITDVKNGNYTKVGQEISMLKEITGSKVLKVIVETCYLTRDEKIAMCQVVTNAGADYIKTSTGFGSAGAVLEDIALFKENIGPNVKIKAAGGIRTKEEIEQFINAGCDRIGASCAVQLLNQ